MQKPIINDGLLKNIVVNKIDEIAKALVHQTKDMDGPGLYNGKAGLSIFFSYLSQFQNSNSYSGMIQDLVVESFNSLNDGYSHATHASGISGMLWSVNYLNTEGVIEVDDSFEELNDFLEKRMHDFALNGNFDFLHGALGVGSYLLQYSDEMRFENIDTLIKVLKEKSIRLHDTVKWESVINIETKEKAFNLSLSHGISSVIVFLSEVVVKNNTHKEAKEMLEQAIRFLLSQKNNADEKLLSLYPSYESNDRRIKESRLSWCYGDLGNAVALYKAGTILNREDLVEEAISILKHAAQRRNLKENAVMDAGICHGTSGIALVFNYFFQKTGIEEFKSAAVYWIEKTLEMDFFEDGLAGYKAHEGRKGWLNNAGLLEGVAGIGLVLTSSISHVEARWSKCLLLG